MSRSRWPPNCREWQSSSAATATLRVGTLSKEVEAARAGPMDACTGVLRPGAYADLVVLSNDIFDVPSSRIADVRVDRTVVEGRTVYRRDRIGLDGD